MAIILVLEVGFDVGVYGTCEVESLLRRGTATVADGVYHSDQGTFSVALPVPPPGTRNPSIQVIQPSLVPTESVLFRPIVDGSAETSGAITFGAGTSEETTQERSEPLEQVALDEIRGSPLSHGGVLLRHEPTTLDGRSAMLAIFDEPALVQGHESLPTYLIVYLSRDQGNSAVVAIRWRGTCRACDAGTEADIRKLDPNISRVVDSFHLDETALRKWDAANPAAEGTPVPPMPGLQDPPVPPGKALVYFYRESHFAGGGLNFHIAENGKEIVALSNGTYLRAMVDPGAHTYIMTAWRSDDDPCPIQLKSGEVRYFEVYVSQPAVWGATLTLSCREVADLQAQPVIATLKEATDD